jgi:hypothetical protein
MKFSIVSSIVIRGLVPGLLISLLACPAGAFGQTAAVQTPGASAPADDHIVSSQALDQNVILSAAERQQNIATVAAFLATPVAERTMQDAHIDAVQVRTAIPTLSDKELKDLAARSADAQQKFAAGGLSGTLLTLIVLGIIVIIVVAIVH